MSRSFSTSFLAGDSAARPFLALDFRDREARARRTRQAAEGPRPAPALFESLAAQDSALPPSATRRANLDALGRPGTAVVVTGQQAGLFLGPLYTFYKAASAVAVARALEVETGARVVPLFWLQTEDHDFAEIDHCHVADANGSPVHLSLADHHAGARVSIRHRLLGEEVGTALDGLGQALGAGPAAAEVLALLGQHYRPGLPMGAAFAGVMAALFADEGLLVLDPREDAIARLAAPLYRRVITDHEAISTMLLARSESLQDAGFQPQVPVRPGCSLLFFHASGPEGSRHRLEQRGETWGLAGAQALVAESDLEQALARTPLRFSTSALLRPVLQDALLPTAAYVGGPAEVSYFAQLAPLYDHFGLPQPLVVQRASFRCLDQRTRSLLERAGLRPADLEQPRNQLWSLLAEKNAAGAPGPTALRAEIEAGMTPHLERLERVAISLDPTLRRPAERTRAAITEAIDRLVGKYARSLAARDGIATQRLERLEAMLFPEGVPQERFYGWPTFAGRVGPASFKAAVLAALAPFEPAVQDLLL